MTTTQNNGLLNSAEVKAKLAGVSQLVDEALTAHSNLGAQLLRAKQGVDILRAEIQNSDDNAWKAALSGLTFSPATSTAAVAAHPAPQGYANVPVAAPVVTGRAANLTEEARKLLHTGHSYEGAIRKLEVLHPTREREHIRRAVGRANGGKP